MRIFSLEAKIQFCLMFTAFGRCIPLPASPMGQYSHAGFLTVVDIERNSTDIFIDL